MKQKKRKEEKDTPIKKNEKLKKGDTSTKKKGSRVKRNAALYEDEQRYDLTETKQQKFNFDKNDLEDEIDMSFLDKKKRKNKKEVVVEKVVYPKGILIALGIIIIGLLTFLGYHFTSFDHNKIKVKEVIKKEEVVPENIVFLGDSITDFYDLEKYYPDNQVVNSGISGNTTEDILNNMEKRVYQYNPSKVFLLIGTNDLNKKKSIEEIVDHIKEIIREMKKNRKNAQLYIESVYPVNYGVDSFMVENRDNEDIKEINAKLKEFCKTEGVTYINTYQELINEDGNLKEEYTVDGLHLSDEGYEIVTKKLKEYLK